MVLQQENRLLGQDVAAMPVGHFAALSVTSFRDGDHQSVDGNLVILTADSITVQAGNTLQKRHVWRQISALDDQIADPFGHSNIDITAP